MKAWNELRGILTFSDKALILCTLAAIGATTTGPFDRKGDADQLLIEVDGRTKFRIPLAEDRNVEVVGPLGTTLIMVENQRASITASPCRNKVCVSFGRISQTGQMAVCLPNAVVIRVVGRASVHGLDAISR